MQNTRSHFLPAGIAGILTSDNINRVSKGRDKAFSLACVGVPTAQLWREQFDRTP